MVDHLACPHCGVRLHRDDRSLRCARGHAFDLARHGYVSLLSGTRRANTADTTAMVESRERFLAGGHYEPIAAAVADTTAGMGDGLVVDIAGGTGYYLRAVLDRHPAAVGVTVDLATAALRRAARAHPRAAAIAADVWGRLPIVDGAAAAVLSVFGPRNGADIARVLEAHGLLVVVTPTRRHLEELVDALGLLTVPADKSERLARSLPGFERVSTVTHGSRPVLGHPEVLDLVSMGPSAHHIDPAELAGRVARLPDSTAVTVAVEVSVFRPRGVTGDVSDNESA